MTANDRPRFGALIVVFAVLGFFRLHDDSTSDKMAMAQLTLRGDLSLLLLFARLLFLELQLFDYRFPREPMRLPTQPLGGWQVDVGEIIDAKPPHRARFFWLIECTTLTEHFFSLFWLAVQVISFPAQMLKQIVEICSSSNFTFELHP